MTKGTYIPRPRNLRFSLRRESNDQLFICDDSIGSSRSARRRKSKRRARRETLPHTLIDSVVPYPVPSCSAPDPYWIRHLSSLGTHGLDILNQCMEYELRPADVSALYDHLRKYKTVPPPRAIPAETAKHVLTIMDSFLPRGVDPFGLLEVNTNWSASPGQFYVERGLKTKRDAERMTIDDTITALQALDNGDMVRARYCRAGGRARLSRSDVESAKKGRLVTAQDARDLRLCQMYAQPMVRALCDSYPTPYALGMSHFHGNALTECERYQGCTVIWGFDVSSMDCSLERHESISWSFAILVTRMRIPETTMKFIWSTVVSRAVAMPDGDVYMVETGLASGHGWTTLIETTWMVFLVHACLFEELVEAGLDPDASRIFLMNEVVMGLLGDDGRIGLRPLAAGLLSWEGFAKRFETYFLGRLRPEKCEIDRFGGGFSVGCVLSGFLGKYYMWDSDMFALVVRPLEESLAIALWPERGVSCAGDSWNIAAGLLIDNRDPRWIDIVRRYLTWLEAAHPDAVQEGLSWHAQIKTTVFLEFTGSGDMEIPLARILTDEELKILYHD